MTDINIGDKLRQLAAEYDARTLEKPDSAQPGTDRLADGDCSDAETPASLAESPKMLSSKFLSAGNLAKFLEAQFDKADWTFSYDLDFENITLEITNRDDLLHSLDTGDGAKPFNAFLDAGGAVEIIDPREGYVPPAFVSQALGFQLQRKALVCQVLQAKLSKGMSLRLVGAIALNLGVSASGWGLRDLALDLHIPEDLAEQVNLLDEEDRLLIMLRFLQDLKDAY